MKNLKGKKLNKKEQQAINGGLTDAQEMNCQIMATRIANLQCKNTCSSTEYAQYEDEAYQQCYSSYDTQSSGGGNSGGYGPGCSPC